VREFAQDQGRSVALPRAPRDQSRSVAVPQTA
jgi:hypothetical protein